MRKSSFIISNISAKKKTYGTFSEGGEVVRLGQAAPPESIVGLYSRLVPRLRPQFFCKTKDIYISLERWQGLDFSISISDMDQCTEEQLEE